DGGVGQAGASVPRARHSLTHLGIPSSNITALLRPLFDTDWPLAAARTIRAGPCAAPLAASMIPWCRPLPPASRRAHIQRYRAHLGAIEGAGRGDQIGGSAPSGSDHRRGSIMNATSQVEKANPRTSGAEAIRPFTFDFSDEQLEDLRRR